jgi:subtilisin family serine protease
MTRAALDLVRLTELMAVTRGAREIILGVIDGPVAIAHVDLADASIQEVPGGVRGICAQASSAACQHGTFVAGMLCAKRGSVAPAICPGCTLLVRPVFAEAAPKNFDPPAATPDELAIAILECINAGARLLNLSLALQPTSMRATHALGQALDYATRRGVIIVAAAGNQATISSTVITSHPWVIPVAACDLQTRPIDQTNLGRSIGRNGVRAPGERIVSLGTQSPSRILRGTSVAAPLVTGAIALAWSEFPKATGADVRRAFMSAHTRGRGTVTPPLLDAWAAYQLLSAIHSGS